MKVSIAAAALATVMLSYSTGMAVAEGSSSGSASGSLVKREIGLHRGLMRRLRSAVGAPEASSNLVKRGYSGQATFYDNTVSEGACGGYTSSGDYIVALNIAQYGNPGAVSSWCGKKLQISYGGKTETATVVDCCPSCAPGSLDMSKGLFSAFSGLGAGVFQMSWTVAGQGGDDSGSNNNNNNNNNDNGDDQKTTTSKRTTTHPTSTHTSTSTVHSTSSTSTTLSSSATSASSTSTASSLPASSESTSTTTGATNNLAQMNQILSGMMNIANDVAQS